MEIPYVKMGSRSRFTQLMGPGNVPLKQVFDLYKKNKKHRTHKEHFTSNFVRVIQTKGKTLSMPVVC